MKNNNKTFIISILILLLTLMMVACGNGELEARTMSILEIDGDTVNLTRAGRESSASAGTRLNEGDALSSGVASFCNILLDARSHVKMDEQSNISIEKLTDNLLSIAVTRGQVLIDVQEQSPEHSTQTQVGNVVFGVRGTLFVAGLDNNRQVLIIMLEGSVETDDGRTLAQGTVANISDGVERVYDISPLVLEELDRFTLQAILDNWERVQNAGVVTPDQQSIVRELLEQRETGTDGPGTGETGSEADGETDNEPGGSPTESTLDDHLIGVWSFEESDGYYSTSISWEFSSDGTFKQHFEVTFHDPEFGYTQTFDTTGVWHIQGPGELVTTADGSTDVTSYAIQGNTLTMTLAHGTSVYTKR
ncbi:MAG: FecR domain-containing protein [Oscillospiraceae bacterium]|nr:FecR domain-containing protein [Oscillospiraceae bacterium]